MKPAAFDYRCPDTVEEALDLLTVGATDTAVLAGGQSLVPLMNLRAVRPGLVVDINRIPGLDRVDLMAGALRIGAMARLCALERDVTVSALLPILPRVCRLVGHPQIRSRSTIGGSLCHGHPAAELPTLAVALDARLHLRSRNAERTVPATAFYRGPRLTGRRPDELLTAVDFPVPVGLMVSLEEISRRINDLPMVVTCVAVTCVAGTVTGARIAVGGIADRPVRLPAAEAALTGRRLDADPSPVLAAVEEMGVSDQATGFPAFRRALLRTAIRRAVMNFATGQEDRKTGQAGAVRNGGTR